MTVLVFETLVKFALANKINLDLLVFKVTFHVNYLVRDFGVFVGRGDDYILGSLRLVLLLRGSDHEPHVA